MKTEIIRKKLVVKRMFWSIIGLIVVYLLIYFKKWKDYKGRELIFRNLFFIL